MPENSLADLIPAAKKNDKDAIATLYEQTHKKVYFTAFMIVKNEQDALDIMQDVFISALRKLKSLKDPNAFEPWLHTIARNKCANFLKKHKELLVDDEHDQLFESIEDFDKEFLPQEALENAEIKETVLNTVKDLPTVLSQTVLYYYFNGMTVTEIASAMSCPSGTVSRRLSSARERIKKTLDTSRRFFTMTSLPIITQLFNQASERYEGWSIPAEKSTNCLEHIFKAANMSIAAIIGAAIKVFFAAFGEKAVAIGATVAIAGTSGAIIVSQNMKPEPVMANTTSATTVYSTPGAIPTYHINGTTYYDNLTNAVILLSVPSPNDISEAVVLPTMAAIHHTTQPQKRLERPVQPVQVNNSSPTRQNTGPLYSPMEVEPGSFGDANNDGWVDGHDCDIILYFLAELTVFNEIQRAASDIDGNGFVDVRDVTALSKITRYGYNEWHTKPNSSPVGVNHLKPPRGDVNGDKWINSADLDIIRNYLDGLIELDEIQLIAADFNQDGTVTEKDFNSVSSILKLTTRITGPKGDLNNDGVINSFDCDIISDYLLGEITLSPEEMIAADFDRNGTVTVRDYDWICRLIGYDNYAD